MKTSIDAAGRVVIPAAVRRSVGLSPGTELEIYVEDDASVRLVRKAPRPRVVRVGRRLVARPTAAGGRLSKLDLAQLVEEERNRWPW